jgi:hypothetical protein
VRARSVWRQSELLWILNGVSQVIVTSFLFPEMKFSLGRLRELTERVGKERLVVDVRYLGLGVRQATSATHRAAAADDEATNGLLR